ncbi:MAG: OmcA/MtrC family decaheme c-type cytochrome [Candidatus Bathyarchaeota archaeon]|nr:OmcA/MtrC family decaheme c-type cytochrome [Candidatus Bathyarchaeota archaeon]
MSNDKTTLYLAIIAIVLATIGTGLAYYKTPGPEGPQGIQGLIGETGPAGPQGEQGLAGVVDMSLISPGAGIDIEVTNVEIGSDGITKVTMTVTDASGQPMTSDFSMSFLLAAIEEDASGTPYYNNYFTRDAPGDEYVKDGETMDPELTDLTQPDRERGGTWEVLAPGELVYTFANAVPSNYDSSATHVFAAYAYQPQRDEIANVIYAFVPDGGTPDVWQVSTTESCNRCHDPLALHGGTRQEYVLCLPCHTPDAIDPESGNSVDMKVMIHKIHMGENLPSVEAGEDYYIVGHRQSVHDYSEVVFPTDVRNCEMCHTGPDGDSYKTNPSRDACGSCHDDVDFATGEGHVSLPQTSDAGCSGCHSATMTKEFDRSVPGAHAIPNFSSQLPGTNIDIVSVSNTGQGQKAVITYTVKNDAGEQIALADINRIYFVVAGPNTDYETYWRESALSGSVDNGDGTYSYTIATAIPSDATGSWSIGVEGRTMQEIDDGAGGVLEVRDLTLNEVYAIPVTDAVAVPRRTVVSQENCESCHENLYLHGGNRKSVEYCATCHMPSETDEDVRPAEAMPPTTVDIKVMIHRIHLGEEGGEPYVIYGHGGSENDFGHVIYSADLANCAKCHVDDSYELPLSSGVLGTTVEEAGEVVSYTPPIQSACLGCHPSDESKAHTETMTANGVESCVVCHGAGKDFAPGETSTVWAEIQLIGLD